MLVFIQRKSIARLNFRVTLLTVGIATVAGCHAGGFHRIAYLRVAVLVAQNFAGLDIAAGTALVIARVTALIAGSLDIRAFNQLPCTLVFGTRSGDEVAGLAEQLAAVNTYLVSAVSVVYTNRINFIRKLRAVCVLTSCAFRGEVQPAAAIYSPRIIVALCRYYKPPGTVGRVFISINGNIDSLIVAVGIFLCKVGIFCCPTGNSYRISRIREQHNGSTRCAEAEVVKIIEAVKHLNARIVGSYQCT